MPQKLTVVKSEPIQSPPPTGPLTVTKSEPIGSDPHQGFLDLVKSVLQAYGAHEANVGRTLIDTAKNHPAATGAAVAGLATAPLTGGLSLAPAMAFSGTMVGGGAALGQLASEATGGPIPTPAEAATEIAGQAAGGAVGEGVGRAAAWAVGKVAPKAAQWLYNLGLKPPKAIRDAFPAPSGVGVTEDLLPNPRAVQARLSKVESELAAQIAKSDALPQVAGLLGPGTHQVVTPLGEAPLGAAAPSVSGAMPRPSMIDPRRLQGGGEFGPVYAHAGTGPRPASGFSGPGVLLREEARTGITGGAGAPPTMVDPRRIVSDAIEYVIREGNLGARALKSDVRNQLQDLAAQYAADNASPMTVAQLLAQKRAEQGLASASYLKLARGGEINDIETLFHQGVANAARKEIIRRVPAAEELLAREQGLIGLKHAAEIAQDRPEVLSKWLAVMTSIGGVGVGGAEGAIPGIVLYAVQSPTLSGAMALATKRLGQIGASQMTPTLFKALAAAYGFDAKSMASHEVKH